MGDVGARGGIGAVIMLVTGMDRYCVRYGEWDVLRENEIGALYWFCVSAPQTQPIYLTSRPSEALVFGCCY